MQCLGADPPPTVSHIGVNSEPLSPSAVSLCLARPPLAIITLPTYSALPLVSALHLYCDRWKTITVSPPVWIHWCFTRPKPFPRV